MAHRILRRTIAGSTSQLASDWVPPGPSPLRFMGGRETTRARRESQPETGASDVPTALSANVT